MALKHGKAFSVTVNSVDMSNYASDGSMAISIDTAETTTAGDSAKTFLEGDYTATHSINGPADFATSTQDATMFALIGAGATNVVWKPQATTVSTTNPSYTQSAIMTSYQLNFGVGDAVKYSAAWQGTSTVARATS